MVCGQCPYCEDGVVTMVKKPVRGVPTRVYQCSNVKVTTEDGECWEQEGACVFTVFGNALARYGKRAIGPKEVRELLSEGSFVAVLQARSGHAYRKYVIPDREYGVTVLFDTDIDEE